MQAFLFCTLIMIVVKVIKCFFIDSRKFDSKCPQEEDIYIFVSAANFLCATTISIYDYALSLVGLYITINF